MFSKFRIFIAVLFFSGHLKAQTFEEISPCGMLSTGVYNNELYFESNDSVYELAATDGTLNGTRAVKQINQTQNAANMSDFVVFNNKLFFIANDGIHYAQIWSTDGTTNGTNMFCDLSNLNVGWPSSLFTYDSLLLFMAEDSVLGTDLCATNGTSGGTRRLRNISGSNLFDGDFAEYNGKVLFESNDGSEYYSLWVTDGTANGTFKIFSTFIDISTLIPYNGKLYFSASDTSSPYQLWMTDGTSAGTERVLSSYPDSLKIQSAPMFYNNKLYFNGTCPCCGSQLWQTDGTISGTGLVKSVLTTLGSTSSNFTVALGKMFFQGEDSINGNQLWVSDGTTSGTHMVKNLNPGLPLNVEGSYPEYMIEYNGLLYFVATVPGGYQLGVSDGTDSGTAIIFPGQNLVVNPLPDANLSNMRVVNGALFLPTQWTTIDVSLWKITAPPSGIRETSHSLSMQLFPDPANDYLTLSLSVFFDGNITIMDITGKSIFNTVAESGNVQRINTSQLNSGVYLLRLSNSETSVTTKFIKQ